jgi:hypothetical protein
VVRAPLSWCAVCCAGNCDDQPLAVAINSATAQGIISAAASGNDAESNSLIIPACASTAVSVGAVYPETVGDAEEYAVCSDGAPQPDKVACFSNRCASRLFCARPLSSCYAQVKTCPFLLHSLAQVVSQLALPVAVHGQQQSQDAGAAQGDQLHPWLIFVRGLLLPVLLCAVRLC